jgi:tetratricopeptide (TPR) repeat protein
VSRIAAAIRLRELGKPRDGLEQLKRELASDPDSVPARLELVWTLIALKDMRGAQSAADEALELEPDNPWAFYAKANAVGCSGDASAARDWVDRALAIAPWSDAFHSYRGALCLTLRQLDDALESVDRALRIDAEDAYALDVRIRVLRALRRDTEALAATRAALARHPERAQFLQHLGELSLVANDPATAGAAFRAVLALDPSRAEAKTGLVDALRAKSALYRLLSSFMRATDRAWDALKTRRGKTAVAAYVSISFAAASCVKDPQWKAIAFAPIGVAFVCAVSWLIAYHAARVVLPVFLVRVMFDSMGKHALKDTLTAKWKRPLQTRFGAVAILTLGIFASLWPWILIPVGLCVPFFVVRRCEPGRWRTALYVVTVISTLSGVIGVWRFLDTGPARGWSSKSAEESIPWIFLSAVLAIAIGVAATIVQRREQRRMGAHDPFAEA